MNMNIIYRIKTAIFLLSIFSPTALYAFQVHEVFPPIVVSESNAASWSTPIAFKEGLLFLTAVIPSQGTNNGINLQTVVFKGERKNGIWNWSSNSIEKETIDDKWHTAASIGIDKDNFIHIAYNMHNMPWQYSVSSAPLDISSFIFSGEKVASYEKFMVKHLKKSEFPSVGSAKIPNNQITYPAFFNDNNNDLFITYRFAAKPKRKFSERELAGGIAKYQSTTKTWISIGGYYEIDNNDALLSPNVTNFIEYPFSLTKGWVVYTPRLAFDSDNNMHVAWNWRLGGPGEDHVFPSYAYTKDSGHTFIKPNGSLYTLPIDVNSSWKVGGYSNAQKYYGPTSILIDSDDSPIVLLQPIGKTRAISKLNTKTGEWSKPQSLPYSASDINIDTQGNLWAISNGLNIFKKNKSDNKWALVYSDKDANSKNKTKTWCMPKSIKSVEESSFFVYTQSCDFKKVRVLQIKWN